MAVEQARELKSLKVLYLEDEPEFAGEIKIHLENHEFPFDLYIVQTVAEYKRLLTSNNTNGSNVDNDAPDIVILDMVIDNETFAGKKLIVPTKAKWPETLVFMLSSYTNLTIANECTALGADNFLGKDGIDEELGTLLYMAVAESPEIQFDPREEDHIEIFRNFPGDEVRRIYNELARIFPENKQNTSNPRKDTPEIIEDQVFISGESGSGKEVAALICKHLYQEYYNTRKRDERNSQRIKTSRQQSGDKIPFIKRDCATLPPNLIQDQLFGHVQGAFDGATKDVDGDFQRANGGILFLDNIENLSMEAQENCLRAIENGEVIKVGGRKSDKVKFLLVSASNANMRQLIDEGKFRMDLWYRIGGYPVNIRPLRERKEDIEQIAIALCEAQCKGKHYHLPKSTVAMLKKYDWPGNVRELKNCIGTIFKRSTNNILSLDTLSGIIPTGFQSRSELSPDDSISFEMTTSAVVSERNDEASNKSKIPINFTCDVEALEKRKKKFKPLDILKWQAVIELVRGLSKKYSSQMSINKMAELTGTSAATLGRHLKNAIKANIISETELKGLIGNWN